MSRLFDHIILALQFIRLFFFSSFTTRKPDLVYRLSTCGTCFYSFIINELTRIKICLDVKDLWPSLIEDKFPPRIKPFLYIFKPFILFKYVVNHSHSICTTTPSFLSEINLQAHRRPSKNDLIAPLSFRYSDSVSLDESDTNWWSANDLLSSDTCVFSFVGSFMTVYDFLPFKAAIQSVSILYPNP